MGLIPEEVTVLEGTSAQGLRKEGARVWPECEGGERSKEGEIQMTVLIDMSQHVH